jgi:hypothetical protein
MINLSEHIKLTKVTIVLRPAQPRAVLIYFSLPKVKYGVINACEKTAPPLGQPIGALLLSKAVTLKYSK